MNARCIAVFFTFKAVHLSNSVLGLLCFPIIGDIYTTCRVVTLPWQLPGAIPAAGMGGLTIPADFSGVTLCNRDVQLLNLTEGEDVLI